MQDARKRRFDAVLVWNLDRWGRSVADSSKGIQELVSLEVRFIAVTQNIDTDESNPMARFLLHHGGVRGIGARVNPGARHRGRMGGAREREDTRTAEARVPAR
jgi:DNA invertase Pin-like site-specific DNA recombinase